MKNFVIYGKGTKCFFVVEEFINDKEQLIKECDTLEEAKELAWNLNKVLNGERFPFNGYSVVYGKGIENFFVIDGDKTNEYELLIESFENEEEAEAKALNLNEINRKSDYN